MLLKKLHDFWVIIARGTHPFPSRTRKLSLSAPMVLRARVRGRVGHRPNMTEGLGYPEAFCL
jgi:hypothetical protein